MPQDAENESETADSHNLLTPVKHIMLLHDKGDEL